MRGADSVCGGAEGKRKGIVIKNRALIAAFTTQGIAEK